MFLTFCLFGVEGIMIDVESEIKNEKDELEIEFELKTETNLEKLSDSKFDDDVAVIILLYKNPNFKSILKPYELEICGKKMWKWLELACDNYPISTAIATPESDIVNIIKPLLTDKKYTMVLFSDTPLITKETIKEILTYVRAKDCNVLNLSRGYVFNTEYIKNISSIKNKMIVSFNESDFEVADDLIATEKISQIIQYRILTYHLYNGVFIKDLISTFIDADVIIESGVIIEPNNIIQGRTYIGKYTFLESGNKIIDSVIGENCILKNSYICNSKVNKNIVVGPFEKVINKG